MSEILPIKRPMKGEQLEDLSRLVFPLAAGPKIDGFRCVLGQQPYTSRLSPYSNVHFKTQLSGVLPRRTFLDAEAVVGKRRGEGVLQRTSSGLTSRSGEPDFTLWCFDSPMLGYGWQDRYQITRQIIESVGHPRIRLLRHTIIECLSDLEEYIDDKLAAGYEGVMVRSLDGHYKQGKSTVREALLNKIKPFVDAEGEVIGYFEEEENTNEAKREITGKLKRSSAKAGKVGKGRLGGLILRDCESGVTVRVGGGFTQEQRIGLWKIRDTLIGKLVKYKKQKMGEKDKPRHPNFLEFIDFRPAWDMV